VKRGSRAVKRTKKMFSSKENEKRFTTICYTRRVGLLFRLFCFVLSNNFYFLPVLGVCVCVCAMWSSFRPSLLFHRPTKKADTVGVCVCGTLTAGSFEPRWAKQSIKSHGGQRRKNSNPKNCQIKTRFSISFSPCVLFYFSAKLPAQLLLLPKEQ
jgi:hypothetical protein